MTPACSRRAIVSRTGTQGSTRGSVPSKLNRCTLISPSDSCSGKRRSDVCIATTKTSAQASTRVAASWRIRRSIVVSGVSIITRIVASPAVGGNRLLGYLDRIVVAPHVAPARLAESSATQRVVHKALHSVRHLLAGYIDDGEVLWVVAQGLIADEAQYRLAECHTFDRHMPVGTHAELVSHDVGTLEHFEGVGPRLALDQPEVEHAVPALELLNGVQDIRGPLQQAVRRRMDKPGRPVRRWFRRCTHSLLDLVDVDRWWEPTAPWVEFN